MENVVNDLEILEGIMKAAQAKGVAADAMMTSTKKESVSCRMQKLENVETACAVNMNLRVIIGKQHACLSTNKLSDIYTLLDKVIVMAKAAPENPYILLPDSNYELDNVSNSLSIFDHTNLSREELIDNAKSTEEAALSYGKIENSEGAYSEHSKSTVSFANTKGMVSSYRKSSFYHSVSVIAKDGKSMEQGNEYSIACHYQDLENPSIVGKKAAERAVKKLHPQKIKTCKVPVMFDANISGSILQSISEAINGLNVADGASFLRDKMNKQIFNKSVTIIDDATLDRGLSSYPFDDEGMASNELSIVNGGKLNNWLLDVQSANKLNLSSNGRASRSKTGVIKPSHSNLYMQPGKFSPEYILAQVKRGVYITDIFGFGSNIITGDYSHGASGFLIEDGEITVPINEFTIAANMNDMFMALMPANDLQFHKLINAPTLIVAEMTVAGQ